MPLSNQRGQIRLSRRSPHDADRVNATLPGKLADRFERDGAHALVFAAGHGFGQRADGYWRAFLSQRARHAPPRPAADERDAVVKQQQVWLQLAWIHFNGYSSRRWY